MTTKCVLVLVTLLPSLASLGCTSSDGSSRVLFASLGDSTISFAWTIDGVMGPETCRQSGATTIEVKVETRDGGSAGEFQGDCDAFGTKVSLAPGSYLATAVLLDSAGRDRTAEVGIERFTLEADDELHVPIEFPSTSFK